MDATKKILDLDATCINTIRTLSMDAVQAANSGHPGLIVLRPADANETAEAWKVIMKLHHEPA